MTSGEVDARGLGLAGVVGGGGGDVGEGLEMPDLLDEDVDVVRGALEEAGDLGLDGFGEGGGGGCLGQFGDGEFLEDGDAGAPGVGEEGERVSVGRAADAVDDDDLGGTRGASLSVLHYQLTFFELSRAIPAVKRKCPLFENSARGDLSSQDTSGTSELAPSNSETRSLERCDRLALLRP